MYNLFITDRGFYVRYKSTEVLARQNSELWPICLLMYHNMKLQSQSYCTAGLEVRQYGSIVLHNAVIRLGSR